MGQKYTVELPAKSQTPRLKHTSHLVQENWNSFLDSAFVIWTLGSDLLVSVLYEEERQSKQPKQ